MTQILSVERFNEPLGSKLNDVACYPFSAFWRREKSERVSSARVFIKFASLPYVIDTLLDIRNHENLDKRTYFQVSTATKNWRGERKFPSNPEINANATWKWSDEAENRVSCQDAHAARVFRFTADQRSSLCNRLLPTGVPKSSCISLRLSLHYSLFPAHRINQSRTMKWIIDCLTTYRQEPHTFLDLIWQVFAGVT